jgi:uncharacterized protein (TIGR03435 family)
MRRILLFVEQAGATRETESMENPVINLSPGLLRQADVTFVASAANYNLAIRRPQRLFKNPGYCKRSRREVVHNDAMRKAKWLPIACVVATTALGVQPSFEVASVRVSGRNSPEVRIDGGPGTNDPGRLRTVNTTLSALVWYAYQTKPHQYKELSWMDEQGFDVNAIVPPGTSKESFYQMLQNLLVERFGLKFHRENKVMSAYELIVAKTGPRLQQSRPGPVSPPAPFKDVVTNSDGFPVLPEGNRPTAIAAPGGKIAVRARDETIEEIAARLSNAVGEPVVDRTGLKGNYDYVLFYQVGATAARGTLPFDGPLPVSGQSEGPTIFQAVERQLGLQLREKKLSVPIFVVDYASKEPTSN